MEERHMQTMVVKYIDECCLFASKMLMPTQILVEMMPFDKQFFFHMVFQPPLQHKKTYLKTWNLKKTCSSFKGGGSRNTFSVSIVAMVVMAKSSAYTSQEN